MGFASPTWSGERRLELGMCAHAKYRNRTAIAVMRRIGHVLIVCANGEMIDHMHGIKRLDDVLGPVVRQLSVSDQDTEPPAAK
jgi:hypothetical protein